MATLTGTTIQSTYDSLLKVTDNDSITGSLKRITDGLGNNTPLYLSSSAVEIVSTLNVTSTITGSNLSGTNTGDETNATIKTKLGAASASQDGYLTSTDWSTFSNKIAGSGTLNKLAKFSSSSSIADSTITDTGSAVTIGVATTVSGNLTATSLIKSGGTSSQILAADGSVITAGTNITIAGGTISSSGSISGTGTANYVAKFTGSTSIGNSLIYDSGTSVGIGIASPSGRFHSLSTGTGSNTISGVFSDGSTNGNAITISNATGLSTISATYLSTSIDSALAFQTTTGGVSSERMRITASGSVGIGTSSPSTTLDVNGSITSSTNVRALRFWGGPSSFTTHSAPLHIFSSTIGTDPIARFNNTESTDASTRTSMWLENYAGYRAEIAYTTNLNGSNIYINNTYSSGNILFNIASSEKARILNTGQFKLNGYTSTSSFTGTAAGYLAFDSSGNILTTAAPSGGITGSGTTNYVPKFTGSSAIGNSLIFDNGINVGIATSSPSQLFQVGNGAGTGSQYARFTHSNCDVYIGQSGGTILGLATGTGYFVLGDSASHAFAVGTTNSQPLILGTTNNERMRITSGGNIGIGTSTILATYGGYTTLELNGTTGGLLSLDSNGSNKFQMYSNGSSVTLATIAAEPIILSTNASEKMRITSTGNVGIGTSSPGVKLDVIGALNVTSDSTEQIVIKTLTNTNRQLLIGYNYTPNYSYIQSVHQGSSYTNLLLQPSGGQVGIGTTTPSNKLQVFGSTDSYLANFTGASGGATARGLTIGTYTSLGAGDCGVEFNAAVNNTGYGQFRFSAGTNERMRIDSSGNVGIGTTSPTAKLTIDTVAGFGLDIFRSDVAANYGAIRFRNTTNSANFGTIGFDSGGLRLDGDAGTMYFSTSGSERMRITSAGSLLLGDTVAPNAAAWFGTAVFGKSGTSKVITGYLTGATNGAIVGGHNSALDNWADLNIAGTNLIFRYNGQTEGMRITSAGNVGIGTSSPLYKLDISVSATGTAIHATDNTNADLFVDFPSSGISRFTSQYGTGGIFVFANGTAKTERMRIDASGNVGIGTSSPGQLLQVGNGAGTGSQYARFYHSATDIYIGQSGGTIFGIGSGAGSFVLSDNALYPFGVGTTGSQPLIFGTSNSEKARIASDGRFQVNNTGYSANCTATLRALTGTSTDKILECMTISYSSAFYVRNDGNYYFSGSNLSDARTKKDINYLEESILDKVMKLKPASFRYKENEENIKGGFIAQDIKEIFPDLVTATKSDDEMMGVDYYGVIAILTKAIQEQQVQIEELKAKLK